MPRDGRYVGRGGEKLKFAIDRLSLEVTGRVAADFGCNIGGFTDCLLQQGAKRVYAVDTGYGMLEWHLRQDERVVVMERTNAMHVELPEPVDLVTADVGWTRQRHVMPNALEQSKPDADILSLFKPQYEAEEEFVRDGHIEAGAFEQTLENALEGLAEMGLTVHEVVRLPQPEGGRNPEAMLYIRAAECDLLPQFRPGGPLGG